MQVEKECKKNYPVIFNSISVSKFILGNFSAFHNRNKLEFKEKIEEAKFD